MCYKDLKNLVYYKGNWGWTVRGSNPGEGEIFRTRPDRPRGPPNPYTTGTGSFTGLKRPGRGVDHPLHLPSRLKKE
jgi:hypothetical protein